MMQNIEIKTPVADFQTIENKLKLAGAEKVWVRNQADTFYEVTRGWLKLREADDAVPELISYQRSTDDSGPRASTYDLLPISEPVKLKRMLERVLDTECVVRKTRTLWIWQHTRIHLDQVEGLGDFLELEAVAKEISIEQARSEADQMIELLELQPERFISVPYREMLRANVGS